MRLNMPPLCALVLPAGVETLLISLVIEYLYLSIYGCLVDCVVATTSTVIV